MSSNYSRHGEAASYYATIDKDDKIHLRLQIAPGNEKIVGTWERGAGDDRNYYVTLDFQDLDALKEMSEFMVRLCIVTELSR